MGNWNLNEFKTFCLISQFDKAWFYTESLAFKYHAAIYHRDLIQKKIAELSIPPATFEKAGIYDYEVAYELDALMADLDSLWDILAQFLRECFIGLSVENRIYFDSLCSKYPQSLPQEIISIVNDIKVKECYKIIKAYSNVSKHRYAIKGEVQIDLGEKPYKVSYDIREFNYKEGQKYKLTPEKAFKCLEFVGKTIDKIGAMTYELLKSKHR